jgi:hypothetical protein
MNGKIGFRLAMGAAALALALASFSAAAAEGASCISRVAGPNGTSGGSPGTLNADGKCVSKADAKAAAKDKEPDGLEASAQCRDLSYSYSKRRDTACAKHGGVMEWLAQQ